MERMPSLAGSPVPVSDQLPLQRRQVEGAVGTEDRLMGYEPTGLEPPPLRPPVGGHGAEVIVATEVTLVQAEEDGAVSGHRRGGAVQSRMDLATPPLLAVGAEAIKGPIVGQEKE